MRAQARSPIKKCSIWFASSRWTWSIERNGKENIERILRQNHSTTSCYTSSSGWHIEVVSKSTKVEFVRSQRRVIQYNMKHVALWNAMINQAHKNNYFPYRALRTRHFHIRTNGSLSLFRSFQHILYRSVRSFMIISLLVLWNIFISFHFIKLDLCLCAERVRITVFIFISSFIGNEPKNTWKHNVQLIYFNENEPNQKQ